MRLFFLVVLFVVSFPVYAVDQGIAFNECNAYLDSIRNSDLVNKTGPFSCSYEQNTAGTAWGYWARWQSWTHENRSLWFPSDSPCLARNSSLGAPGRIYVGAPPSCVAGCGMTHGATISTAYDGQPVSVTTTATQYTGDVCSASTPTVTDEQQQQKEVCTPLPNGQTGCVQPDKRVCYTASTGTKICWLPGQSGDQSTGPTSTQVAAADPSTPPSTPPPPDSTWQPTDTTTVTNTSSTSTTTINITNYTAAPSSTSPGTDPGTDPGTGGGDSGTDPGTDPGTGGTDSGTGDGQCDGTGDCTNAGGAGQGVGRLYSKGQNGKTLSGVLSAHMAAIESVPILNAAQNFFALPDSGAQCPVWQMEENEYFGTLVFDAHCNGDLADLLYFGGLIMMMVAAAAAFHIGIGY